jgi:hypothetical protein
LIYFLVKDQVLSGMNAGKQVYKVISCTEGDAGVLRHKLKGSGYSVLMTSTESFEGYISKDWQSIQRLKGGD